MTPSAPSQVRYLNLVQYNQSTVQHLNSTSRQAFPLQPQHTIACPSNYQENISCIGLGKHLRNCCQDSAVEQEMNGNSQSKPDASDAHSRQHAQLDDNPGSTPSPPKQFSAAE
jgi:hypothetical protein